jgi:hypothetical protein
MKFQDSSELYFQIHADNRGLALAYAPAFVQEIVDGLKLNQRVVWSCQGDNTVHITSAGRYKNIDMLYPNSLENKLLGIVGFGKGSRGKSIKQKKWNEFTSFFFSTWETKTISTNSSLFKGKYKIKWNAALMVAIRRKLSWHQSIIEYNLQVILQRTERIN